MMNVANRNSNAIGALQKAVETRRVWMEALSGKIGKEELNSKGIRFIQVTE